MKLKITRFEDMRLYDYIFEIDRYEQFLRRRPDLECKKRINEEIKQQEEMIEKYSAVGEPHEIDSLWEEFVVFESEKIDEYYNEMTSYFKTLYAIFENQTARETRRLDFSRYPKIREMNWAVNVLKHAQGPSYQNLVDNGSKFVQEPVEFTGILRGTTASEILNLEFQDLIDFCNEARVAWADRLKEEQDEFEASRALEASDEDKSK